MKVLLASPILTGEFDSGIYILKALSDLGHSVSIWDYRLEPDKKIDMDYDLFLVNKGESIDPDKFKSPKICWYPDQLSRFPVKEKLEEYDAVYSINKPENCFAFVEWAPGAYCPEVHRYLGIEKSWKTIYIGTCNSQRKLDWIREINPQLIYGNLWRENNVLAHPPQYSTRFTMMVNQACIAINVHQSDWGTNRKLFELVPCTFTITDRVEGVEDIFGKLADKMSFETPAEAKELIAYYLENESERLRLWEQEKKIVEPYTYKNQVKKILDEAL